MGELDHCPAFETAKPAAVETPTRWSGRGDPDNPAAATYTVAQYESLRKSRDRFKELANQFATDAGDLERDIARLRNMVLEQTDGEPDIVVHARALVAYLTPLRESTIWEVAQNAMDKEGVEAADIVMAALYHLAKRNNPDDL
jgi:hypothetical protein